jgi:hypothetical protein
MRIRRLEVIAVACVALALAVWGFVASQNLRNYGQTECFYNLRVIHLDYVNYFVDHGKFVTQVSTNQGGTMEFADQTTNAAVHFQAIVLGETPVHVEAPIHYLVCPLDKSVQAARPDKLTNTNVSYFLSVNAPSENGQWILSGNRNLSFAGEPRKADWNPTTGLHGETGYLLFLDGAVTRVDSIGLEKFFKQGGNPTNRIAMP